MQRSAYRRHRRHHRNAPMASNDGLDANLSSATSNRASLACGEGTAMAETRKLAAILAADVAGYSRLAAADEDRTLSRLRGLRSDLIDPAIAAHHGRIVKRTGMAASF